MDLRIAFLFSILDMAAPRSRSQCGLGAVFLYRAISPFAGTAWTGSDHVQVSIGQWEVVVRLFTS